MISDTTTKTAAVATARTHLAVLFTVCAFGVVKGCVAESLPPLCCC